MQMSLDQFAQHTTDELARLSRELMAARREIEASTMCFALIARAMNELSEDVAEKVATSIETSSPESISDTEILSVFLRSLRHRPPAPDQWRTGPGLRLVVDNPEDPER